MDIFTGIGGFTVASSRCGYRPVVFCESDDYCRRILTRHWPEVPIHDDVRSFNGLPYRGADLVTGGWPCQDISTAGKQAGIAGERSGLWTELSRVLGEIRPRYAVLENVPMLLAGDRGQWFGQVLGDLAEIGYDCQWHCVPACAVNAPHQRDRVWIIAYPRSDESGRGDGQDRPRPSEPQSDGEAGSVADSHSRGREILGIEEHGEQQGERGRLPDGRSTGRRGKGERAVPHPIGASEALRIATRITQRLRYAQQAEGHWSTEPNVGRMVDGCPDRSHRLRGLGNAIVPQVAEVILRAIQ